jgi:dTDP-4-amino-4,6-dideoxygalactose transaminase
MTKIPFNKPTMVGREAEYMHDAIARGQISGDGFYTKQCSALLENALGASKVLLTTSCTHALELSALLINIAPGDEVIVPSFTFTSTINAYVLRGAIPVFADIRPDTLNLDERTLERHITPRTRAIVPVHYAGVGCEMDTIMEIAARHHLPVIEDNAHALFAKYKGKFLGTFGAMATQSFHETKNFTCGEGGALVINALEYVERAEIIREKGTNRSRFFRGQVDKYTWVDLGSSYLPSDMLAAFLLAQLEQRENIQQRRAEIWTRYANGIRAWAEANNIQLPYVPPDCEQSYHMFYILMPSLASRQQLIAYLKEHSIQSVFHYLPLHLSDMGMKFGGRVGDCPVTESVSERLLRLPFYYSLSEAEQERVIETIIRFQVQAPAT